MTEERRVVTLLFADVTGSTALGESLDPEDLRALLARYYATAKDVIAAHGGTIEKFIGDAVMAVFGLPVAHGDDAERALAAAIELRDRIRADPKLGERIPVRLGVNTGDVVAARDTSGGDFLVTGDAVNVTARLEQNAEPWQILVGERTVHAADRAFEFTPLATIAAKGKSGGVRAAAVIGAKEATRRLSVPLIGREVELAQLELAGTRARRDKRPSLVSIVAPAGTGKSRLLEEFLDRLPSVAPGATAVIAQCLPYGQRLTYWPLRAVLFRLIGVGEDAEPGEIRDAIARWLDVETLERERVATLLAATVGASESEVLDRAALFAAWRTALEVAARRAPLVIVFEDLHWSSDSLLDLVEFVMQPRGDAAVLTIALARPELLDRRPGWGGGRRNYTSISLDPLRDEEIATLVRHLLEASPSEVVERVVARAEGNPFFAGELVRAIMERAGSLDDPGAVERALAALPDTVQATVLARLDLLPPAERRVLQMGAVLGRTFRAPGVAALAPDVDDVAGAIEELIGKDLVRPSGADAVTFRHTLIREVAYQTLPRSERARLHARAGEWLEETARGRDEAFAELIAFHYREAVSLPGLDAVTAEDVRRRATRWLTRAGDIASAAAAQLEARRHYLAAIDLASAELLPDLYEKLGDAFYQGSESVEAYKTALRLAREQGRGSDQQLRILGGLLMVYMRMQGSVPDRPSPEQMEVWRDDARTTFAGATDDRAIARYLAADAFFPFWINNVVGVPNDESLDEAEARARRALEITQRIGDVTLQSVALDAVGSIRLMRGDFSGTRALALRRTEMSELDLVERMDAYAVAVWQAVWIGDLDGSIRISDEALRAAQPGQALPGTLHMVSWRTYAQYLRGDWNEVIRSGERMWQLWMESDQVSAGYAVLGFVAAYDAARAMRVTGVADRMRETAAKIGSAFPTTHPSRVRAAYAMGEVDVGAHASTVLNRPSSRPDDVERIVALACDRGTPPDAELLQAARPRVRGLTQARPAQAQIDRAFALMTRDAAALERVQQAFDEMGARPYAARVTCERALLVGDRAGLDSGLAELEHIGDLEQIERYEQRARGK